MSAWVRITIDVLTNTSRARKPVVLILDHLSDPEPVANAAAAAALKAVLDAHRCNLQHLAEGHRLRTWTPEEVAAVTARGTDGKYTRSAIQLAIALGRSIQSIQRARTRYADRGDAA